MPVSMELNSCQFMAYNSKYNSRHHEYRQMANLSKSHATCEAAKI